MTNKRWARLIWRKRDQLVKFINQTYADSFDSQEDKSIMITISGNVYCTSDKEYDDSIKVGVVPSNYYYDDNTSDQAYLEYIKSSGLSEKYENYLKENKLCCYFDKAGFDFLVKSNKIDDFDKWIRNKLTEEFINSNKALEMIKDAYNKYAFKQE